MTEEQIKSIAAPDELLSEELLNDIFDTEDDITKARLILALQTRARELGRWHAVKTLIKAYESEERKLKRQYQKINSDIRLEYDAKGNTKNSPTNFENIIRQDPYFKGLRYNLLSHSPEIVENGFVRTWDDFDDKKAISYIYKRYKINNPSMCLNALALVSKEREYHPIKEQINNIEWDGVSRVEKFLTDVLQCDDTPYTREASRLIFAGGIHRIYKPGCKFDSVPVLIGRQGTGKSSVIRWLALDDKFYTDIYTIEGKNGLENLSGKWICELSELLALKQSKGKESIKSFLSRQTDYFRRAFAMHEKDYPRQCIFIGTTNDEQFLTDRTGNRRFLPVKVHSNGYALYKCEAEIKKYIRQCWAEAKSLFEQNKLPPYPNPELLKEMEVNQNAATVDDYRIGLIKDYLIDKDEICILELWQEALNEPYAKPKRSESDEIAIILNNFSEWERQPKTKRFYKYGVQGWWKRKGSKKDEFTENLD